MNIIKLSKLSQLHKRKEVTMFLAIILVLLVLSLINRELNNLEHQQQVLCYDLQILSQKIRERENKIW